MTTFFSLHKATAAFAVALAGLFMGLLILQAQASANDSSIVLKKDPATGLFTLTIKDPDGIQEFSMTPSGKLPYGGGLNGCPKTFVITNTNFDSSSDFDPVMKAYVIDCQNNTANLEIAPPKDGLARSVSLVKEEAPPPPAPAPREEPTEKKKGGPLSASNIAYPVKELGGCQNETECRSYCDNSSRAKECFAFAKKYNLISEKEAEEAEKRFFDVKKGPGGCNSGVSCEAYCNTIDHLDACIAFAEESGYYSGDKLAEAKKFQTLVKSGRKFPGGCKDRNTCEVYCSDARHMEECLNFAEETGFMPEDEIAQARKILPLMQRGETPGGCASKEQCEKYCFEDNHADECIAFGEKVGLISREDAAMIKKTGGKGPGGCRSKEQCESYCETNGDACFQWAQDNGFVDEKDLARMKKGMSRFKDQLDKMPPEVAQCLKDAAGEKNFNKLTNGEPVFDRGLEGKMKTCFSQLTSQVSQQFNALPPEAIQCIKDVIGEEGLRKIQSGEFDEDVDFSSLEGCFQKLQSSFGGGPGGPGGFAGPGGCKSIDECTAYCQAHLDECQQFAPPGGGGFPGPGGQGGFQGGPGGCKSQEECVNYCKANPDECKNFMPPSGGVFPGGGPTGGEFPGSGATGGEFPGGPGGCQSKEECQAYCQAHPQECGGGSSGGSSSGFSGGPGGCKSIEECTAYCQTHLEECAGFLGGGGTGGGPVCDYAQPPQGCSLIPGPSYNPQTKCGLQLSCPVTKSAEQCVPPPSGLVSWWNGESLSGAAQGAVAIVPDGKVGSGFKFDGSGSISMGNPANLNFGTGPFSLEAWVNWSGLGSINNIIRKSDYPVAGPGAGYWLRIGAGKLEFSVGATTQAEGQSIIITPITSGAWHHIFGTKDGSGMIQLYIDGRAQGDLLRQASDTNVTSDAPFTLGAWDDRFGVKEFFSGMIDEVSAYNRALSAGEVLAIFNAGSAGKCASSAGVSSSPPAPAGYSQQIPQEYCSAFVSVPNCSYVGAPGSQNYEYCKQCFPDKAGDASSPSGLILPPQQGLLGLIAEPFLRIFR